MPQIGRSARWIAAALALLGTRPAAADEAAQPPIRATVSARLLDDDSGLAGTAVLGITNDTGVSLAAIPLWLYPNRFRDPSRGLDERTLPWLYPGGEQKGAMRIAGARWNGFILPAGAVTEAPLVVQGRAVSSDGIAWVRLPKPLAPGETGELAVDFAVEIPERRGRFGRWEGVVALGGPWFPRPLPDLLGRDTEQPLDAVDLRVRVSLPPRRGAVLHDRVFPWSEQRRTIEVADLRAEDAVLVTMDRMEVAERRFPWGTAYHVHRELNPRAPEWKDRGDDAAGLPNGLPDSGKLDYSDRAFTVVGNTADLLRELAPACPLPERLVLVDIPAWDRLVQNGPGPVLVSDRIWRLVPLQKALWFHDLALARAVGAELAWPALQRSDRPTRRYVFADLVGAFLAKRYSRAVHEGKTSLEDLVGFASFVPIVDNLLYAPQVPFKEVYDPSIEEPDPLRDEPWRAMNLEPRGKRLLGKLEDLAGDIRLEAALRRALAEGAGLEDLAAEIVGGDPAWFFAQWWGDYPEVNYRLGAVEDAALPSGKVLHRAEVVREGAVIREPVAVRLTDEKGASALVTWPGQGRTGIVEWISDAPIDEVRIDPEGRLAEAPELTPGHPLADNVRRLSWRPPMLTRLLVWGDVTAGEPYAQLSFALRRRYDVTNAFTLGGEYTPSSWGGSLGYLRYFGAKRTLNARSWYAGPVLGASRYDAVGGGNPLIPDETRFGATMGSVSLVGGYDNRVYTWDPMSGKAFYVVARYGAGQADDDRFVQLGSLAARFFGLASAAAHHTFAFYGGAVGLVGEPVAANLATLGDRQILRGFDVDETYGRLGLYAVTEYRFTLFDLSDVRAPIFSWFESLQGVLFLGGGTMSLPDGYGGLFGADRLFSEAGVGLRLHALILGVQQYLVGLDFAWPITPLVRETESLQADDTVVRTPRAPWKIIFGITQTY